MLLKSSFILIILMWTCATVSNAQASLSGTINTTATPVTSIIPASADVTSTAGFSVNDTVLVIQMKGASMDESNTAAFGSVTGIGDAGNYEFAVICDITGLTITFQADLTRSFTAASNNYVQMIKITSYGDVTVDGLLTAPAWDVNTGTGGVLVILASGSVTLNAEINMDARGFSGGWEQNDYSACTCGCNDGNQYTDYYYPSASCSAASKGEGITDTIIGKEFGMGPQVNGGGGGNDHNSGGGGGANYGAGGLGGWTTTPSCFFGAYCRGLFPGIGGNSLSAYYGASNKIFMGGGGGAGHSNNPLPTEGKNGGGIVIIKSNTLVGLSDTIFSRGENVWVWNDGDGAGAGGAGGTVLLDVNTITASPLGIRVDGGQGGDIRSTTTTNCKGPGGGGGGGLIWSQNVLPGTVVTFVQGGNNGTQLLGPCAGQDQGALPGAAGGVISGLAIDFTGLSCILLPVEMKELIADCDEDELKLNWITESESNNDYFEIEYSMDGYNFEAIDYVQGSGNSQSEISYEYLVEERIHLFGYFRLRQVDFNGAFDYSNTVHVNCLSNEPLVQIIDGQLVILNNSTLKSCKIYDMMGRMVFSGNPTKMKFKFAAESFYVVHLETEDGPSSHKVYSR